MSKDRIPNVITVNSVESSSGNNILDDHNSSFSANGILDDDHNPSSFVNGILDGNNAAVLKPQVKHYKTMIEYGNLVTNELPQRQVLYMVDLADVLWKVQEWKKWLPKVEIFYAVKANSDPILLKLLALLGLSFDCASQGECEQVLSAGAPAKNIIFANTIKTTEEMQFASTVGISLMTFDNQEELLKIHREFPKAKLVIRVKATKLSCVLDVSVKFGCNEEKAAYLLNEARKLNLEVVGVSFHVGALCTDPISYTSTMQSCRRIFDVARSVGFSFTILDIGGGFFGQIDTEYIFHKMATEIRKAVNEHFPADDVRVIAEPGCYLVSSAVRVICTVIGKRVMENAVPGQLSREYFLNDSIYGSFFRSIELYGIKIKPLLPESIAKSRPVLDSRLFGQTCCPMDVIQSNTPLLELEVGERVMWENMGAYCRSRFNTFCGIPLPESRYLFVQNHRLNMEWVNNREDVQDFLKKHTMFFGSENEDISQ